MVFNNPDSYLSSYLTTPQTHTLASAHGRKLHNRLHLLWRLRPRWPWRAWGSLALWGFIIGFSLYAYQHQSLPQPPLAVASEPITSLAKPIQANLSNNTKATLLPGGPTGQSLPPGTMAPVGTFANSYARGQCTWYVASRRSVPAHWGHARSWFAHAQGAGWSTGTTPAIAAIAWSSSGYYGHVALVEEVDNLRGQVLISEMNYYGPYRYSKRWVPAGQFKYIY